MLRTLWSIRSLDVDTVKGYSRHLRALRNRVDLGDPGAVERFILGLPRKNKYKNHLLTAYSVYCRANGLEWRRPANLRTEPPVIKVPTEERIDLIISSSTPTYSAAFSLSKLGLRPDEVSKVLLRDLDLGRGELVVRTSKQGSGRTVQLGRRTTDLFRDYVGLSGVTRLDQRLFASGGKIGRMWVVFRRRAYEKLRDPELLKIRLYDLRHWFGTTMYLKTRDIFHVKYLMGHRTIQSTMIYMHVAQGLVNYSEEYTCRVAHSVEEATTLIEQGFEYVTDYDNVRLFRKRK